MAAGWRPLSLAAQMLHDVAVTPPTVSDPREGSKVETTVLVMTHCPCVPFIRSTFLIRRLNAYKERERHQAPPLKRKKKKKERTAENL